MYVTFVLNWNMNMLIKVPWTAFNYLFYLIMNFVIYLHYMVLPDQEVEEKVSSLYA